MPDRPALSDHALRETLDLLGEVVASMAQKLDSQDETRSEVTRLVLGSLDRLMDDVAATKAQTDPAGYARHIGAQVEDALDPVVNRLAALQDGFATDRRETQRRLDALVEHEEQVLVRLRKELARAEHRNRRRPFIALLGLVLALGLAFTLPRLMAGNAATCAVIGGDWSVTESGDVVCVFSAE